MFGGVFVMGIGELLVGLEEDSRVKVFFRVLLIRWV